MIAIEELKISDHAFVRTNQRGISQRTLSFVLEHADTWLHAGEGCMSARISKKSSKRLIQNGCQPSEVDRAGKVVVVVNFSDGEIVTVMHDKGTKCGRHYRKQFPTRSRKRKQMQCPAPL